MNKPSLSQSPVKISPEWITFAIALSILALVFALLIYTWRTDSPAPPILSVTTGEGVRQVEQQFYVPFTIKNMGGETAESVQIVGELKVGEAQPETGEQSIDFLSAGEEQEGAFIFSQDPQSGELSIRVASYKLP